MPEVVVYLAEGRPREVRHALLKDITQVMASRLDVPADRVVVQIVEVSRDNKSRGGVPMSAVVPDDLA